MPAYFTRCRVLARMLSIIITRYILVNHDHIMQNLCACLSNELNFLLQRMQYTTMLRHLLPRVEWQESILCTSQSTPKSPGPSSPNVLWSLSIRGVNSTTKRSKHGPCTRSKTGPTKRLPNLEQPPRLPRSTRSLHASTSPGPSRKDYLPACCNNTYSCASHLLPTEIARRSIEAFGALLHNTK